MNGGVNWIAAYNRLFVLLDRSGTPTYYSGPNFLRMVQQVDPGSPSYDQLIPLRNQQGKSTSRHPEHSQFSVAEMLEHERAHLMSMPEPFDGYVERPARVTSTCLVSVARNRYSVPCELAGQMVSTRLYPTRVVVVANDEVVAQHERLTDRGQTRYDWQHYIPLVQRKPGALRNGAPFADLPPALQQLRTGLLRQAGGDRVMAQVLAIVSTAGLDAVLVAVELALESAPPSGKVSVEHVINVLSRLNPAPTPDDAQTSLQATVAPLANTARYDSLRGQGGTEEINHA